MPLMKFGKRARIVIAAIFLIGTVASIGWRFLRSLPKQETPRIILPVLSAAGRKGRKAFATNCAGCHGKNGIGADQGPPLIHRIYHPGHHADFAFLRAVRSGVRAHHWDFGNMPPQPQVSREQITAIIRFVREVQKANGIF